MRLYFILFAARRGAAPGRARAAGRGLTRKTKMRYARAIRAAAGAARALPLWELHQIIIHINGGLTPERGITVNKSFVFAFRVSHTSFSEWPGRRSQRSHRNLATPSHRTDHGDGSARRRPPPGAREPDGASVDCCRLTVLHARVRQVRLSSPGDGRGGSRTIVNLRGQVRGGGPSPRITARTPPLDGVDKLESCASTTVGRSRARPHTGASQHEESSRASGTRPSGGTPGTSLQSVGPPPSRSPPLPARRVRRDDVHERAG